MHSSRYARADEAKYARACAVPLYGGRRKWIGAGRRAGAQRETIHGDFAAIDRCSARYPVVRDPVCTGLLKFRRLSDSGTDYRLGRPGTMVNA